MRHADVAYFADPGVPVDPEQVVLTRADAGFHVDAGLQELRPGD